MIQNLAGQDPCDLGMWMPDTFISNALEVHSNAKESFVRVGKGGEVKTSQRITVKVPCPVSVASLKVVLLSYRNAVALLSEHLLSDEQILL